MEDFWKQLHWYNIPELESKSSSFDENQILLRILLSVDYNIYADGKPTYVYLYNHAIPEIATIHHSDNAIEKLNSLGVDFYLYEPLCIRNSSQLSHFDNVVFASEHDVRADELDSILNYVLQNRLTNVTVYVGDYDATRYLSHYTPYMNIEVKDLHLLTIDPIQVSDTSISPNFTHKFINLNWRYTTYRHMIASYLSDKDSYISWYYEGSLPTKTEWYDLHTWDSDLAAKVQRKLSRKVVDEFGAECVNTTTSFPNGSVNQFSSDLEVFYRDSFCDIIGESRFHRPLGNLSEKTFKPLYYKKPFVLAGPVRTLEYLRTLGFKTFGGFWDESYDLCEDHQERIIRIMSVIDYIDSKSLSELTAMYMEMVPILEHNFQRANEFVFPYLHEYARRNGLL